MREEVMKEDEADKEICVNHLIISYHSYPLGKRGNFEERYRNLITNDKYQVQIEKKE
jgi:hypothetical protein